MIKGVVFTPQITSARGTYVGAAKLNRTEHAGRGTPYVGSESGLRDEITQALLGLSGIVEALHYFATPAFPIYHSVAAFE